MHYKIYTGLLMVIVADVSVRGQSNVDANHKHAWGENIGWTNWRDADGANDGVVVGPNFLSGNIWAENVGYINVGQGNGPYGNNDDTNYGVNINANGNLYGMAWSENIGWVNCDTRVELALQRHIITDHPAHTTAIGRRGCPCSSGCVVFSWCARPGLDGCGVGGKRFSGPLSDTAADARIAAGLAPPPKSTPRRALVPPSGIRHRSFFSLSP